MCLRDGTIDFDPLFGSQVTWEVHGSTSSGSGYSRWTQDSQPTYQDCTDRIPGFVWGEVTGSDGSHYFLVDNPDKIR